MNTAPKRVPRGILFRGAREAPALIVIGALSGAFGFIVASGGASTPLVPPPAPTGVVEGVDYAFARARADGPLVHWPCDAPTRVALDASAPAGAERDLETAIARTREASGIPLLLAAAGGDTEITVRYAARGEAADDPDLAISDEEVLGRTLTSTVGDRITRAVIVMRSDHPLTAPGTDSGLSILLHELLHAVGLDHGQDGVDEVMTPRYQADRPALLGRGDAYALSVVGCDP